jgi:sugar phosphate isomerase/epimerase
MRTPSFSVNEGMTPGLSFAEDLVAIREAGAGGIGIAAGEVGYGRRKLRDESDLELFRASGLQAGFCNPGIASILPRRQQVAGVLGRGPADPALRVERICGDIRRLAPFDPVCCICVPGPVGRYEPAEAREIAVAGLRQVVRVAAELEMTVAIEPMHSSISDEFSFLTSLPDAVELLEEIDEPNTGILFDVWHLWDSPDVCAHIRAHADRIVGVHVDDWREPTRSWCDRVLPGDGEADLDGIFRALRDGGFDGWFELEVLSDDGTFGNEFPDSLWKRDPVELIREGRTKFLDAWQRSGAPLPKESRSR